MNDEFGKLFRDDPERIPNKFKPEFETDSEAPKRLFLVTYVMADEDRKYDALYQLTTHADHLNSIDTPDPNATVAYELLSGALIWSDETNTETPVHVFWALRQLFAHRTQLMLDDAEPDEETWNQFFKLFPNWIGFLPERRKPAPELLAEYRRGRISLKKCLRDIDRDKDFLVGESD